MRLFSIITFTLIANPWSLASAQSADCQAGAEALQKKNYPAAVSHLNSCLRSDLQNEQRVSLLMLRAQAYQGLNKLKLAVNDQQEAIALDKSRDAWPWIMLSVFRREQKQYQEALAAIKEAEKRDEDGPGTGPGMAVFYHKGWALHEAGRYKAAIEAYTRGIARQPDYGWTLYRRAIAYEAIGNRVQAKRDLFRVAELNPQDGYEAHIVAKLREYGFDAKVREE